MRILDTHLHLIYPDRFSYLWMKSIPKIDRPWSIDDYLSEAVPLGIESALHMEADVIEADIPQESEFALSLPHITGAVAACRPEDHDFPDQIERLIRHAGIRGVRRILHQSPDELSQSDRFISNIRCLSDFDLSFDLCVRADQLAIGRRLVERAPEVTFILDHCGMPDIVNGEFDDWCAHIREAAYLPNLCAKISGVIAYACPRWSEADISPYIEQVIDCFGWDRIVWGSDYPVVMLNGSLSRWVEVTKSIIKHASTYQQAGLLYRNAEQIYRLPHRPALSSPE